LEFEKLLLLKFVIKLGIMDIEKEIEELKELIERVYEFMSVKDLEKALAKLEKIKANVL
jgi:hypothetical protein